MRRLRAILVPVTALFGLTGFLASAGASPQLGGTTQPDGPSPYSLVVQSCIKRGSGPSYIRFCVSKHGNVVSLEAPKGFEHINVGSVYEGYAICSQFVSKAFDVGPTEARFGAAVIAQPGGPNTLPLTITRLTKNGTLRLRQSYVVDPLTRQLTVTMRLTNLSVATMTNIGLARVVDLDVDGQTSTNWWDESEDSIFARDTHVVSLSVLTLKPTHGPGLRLFTDFQPWADAGACAPFIQPNVPFQGDGAGGVGFRFPSISPGQTKTVQVAYRVF